MQIPSLDDAESIQVALTTLIRAICYNHITERKAGLALYGLQLAAMNVSRVKLATTTDHYTKVDPNPIGEFWSGDGYRKYIAKRGLALLKAQELEERPEDNAQEEQDKLRHKWALEDAAGVKRSARF
ncbi:MAG: hypothetical protein JWO13_3489 [Acidobacteriales bacterium]|nr:hypothetical protein [Terriglobales bacterium]